MRLRRPRALLLDRDGVINRELGHAILHWDQFAFLPNALRALAAVAHFPGPIVIVTNQSAIGRGWATQAIVDDIHQRMLAEIKAAGGRIDDILVCPHAPDAGCACRKPKPGLLLEAARRYGVQLEDAWVVGDGMRDVEAGLAVGGQPIFIRGGKPLSAADTERLQELEVPALDDLLQVVGHVFNVLVDDHAR